ncbi:hypothetical protein EJB05_45756 [Eragrostis curvula]|uniref:Peptidase A1 domain-containing protein n=1 Tax=Eragrostis curvula TaxID=38414 RepID=A0A5J9TL59_9POAL|nr:hypothetical protein EJB05_45756 [Eragrostis curvula]
MPRPASAAAPSAAALLAVTLVAAALRGATAKTTIEPCSGADACTALLGYTLYADMKVSEVAALFGADPAAVLAANALDFASPGAANRILPAGLPLRVPTRCACADGVRKSVSVRYAARPADTLASIADVVFAGLASTDQIRTANGLAAEDPDAPLGPGQTLVIPLPCVCFNSTDNNLPAIYLSYVVRVGDTVQSIAASHATTVTDISNVNAMGSPIVAPGDILAIPLPACASSFPGSASDYGLLVANGTYALTAGNCVECSCGPANLNLYCMPASLTASCSSMQCSNSSLMLGNVTAQPTSGGCSVSSCDYAGSVNGTISTSLSSGLQPTCPGPHQFPPLTALPTAANHGSYSPSPAPGPAEAGGAIPGSSLPGGQHLKVALAEIPIPLPTMMQACQISWEGQNLSMLQLLARALFLTTMLLTTPPATSAAGLTIRADLTHVDSGRGFTKRELLSRMAARSSARAASLHHPPGGGGGGGGGGHYNHPATASAAPGTVGEPSTEYLIHLGIGTPQPQHVALTLDTGSDLVWTQCKPCPDCFDQPSPMFDPSASKTIYAVSCNDPLCAQSGVAACYIRSHGCFYLETYGDKSIAAGTLARDTFTFKAPSGGKAVAVVPNLAFGCGLYNMGVFETNESGIAGFGRGQQSLPSQLKVGRFSYCFTSMFESSGKSSPVFLGTPDDITAHATGPVQSTPMPRYGDEPYYSLIFKGITVGATRLPIDESVFARKRDGSGGTIIDSGSGITTFPRAVYDQIATAF